MAVLLVTACVPTIPIPFSKPQKATCRPIPIGIVIGVEDVADAQDQREGYELARSEINQSGGVEGCPIQLIYNDSEGEGTSPDIVQSAMLELADGGQVAVLGATTSAAAKRIAAIAQYIKIPVVITPDTPDNIMANASSWIFRINPANKVYAGIAFDMVKDTLGPAARVAILYEQTEYGEDAAITAGDAVLNRDLQLTSYLSYNPASMDYTALLTQVRDGQADALYLVSTDPGQARAILTGIASLGLRIPLVIGNGAGFTSHEFLYNQAGQLNAGIGGMALTVPWSPDLKGRPNPDFNQRLADFRKSDHTTATHPAVVGTIQAYTALHLLADAITETAKASPKDWNAVLSNPDQLASYRGELAQTLRSFKAAEHSTMLGAIEFDADGQNRVDAVIVQAISGSLVTVYPKTAAVRAPVLAGR